MKPASAALIALLNNNSVFLMADCYTVTLQGGAVYRWSNSDTDIVLGGNTFAAAMDQSTSQPITQRGAIRMVAGLETDTMDLTFISADTVLIAGIPLTLAVHNGILDGARVRVERVYMPTWGDTTPGSVTLFEGMVASADPSSTQISVSVKSDLERLNVMMPRTLIMPGCANAFGDSACGKSIPALTVTGTVGASPAPTASTFTTGRAEADGYFVLGVLAMTSGPAAGARRAVKIFSSGMVTLAMPLPVVPGVGNTFAIYPGCDRQFATCGSKFANSTRFRGCPFVPRPESVR